MGKKNKKNYSFIIFIAYITLSLILQYIDMN